MADMACHSCGEMRKNCQNCGFRPPASGRMAGSWRPAGTGLAPGAGAVEVLEGDAQAVEGEERFDAVDGGAVRGDACCDAAGRDDERVLALPFGGDAANDAGDGVDGGEEDAAPQGVFGGASDDASGLP